MYEVFAEEEKTLLLEAFWRPRWPNIQLYGSNRSVDQVEPSVFDV
jgi:hypothetical protein